MCFLKFLHTPSTQVPAITKDTFSPFTTFTQPFSPQSLNQQQSPISSKQDSLKSALLNCLKIMNHNSQMIHNLDDVPFPLFRNWKKVIHFYIEVIIYFLLIIPSQMRLLQLFPQRLWKVSYRRLRDAINQMMNLQLDFLERRIINTDLHLLTPSLKPFIKIETSLLR